MSDHNADADLTVLYNGECPVCAAEMKHYKELAAKTGAPIAFKDLTKDQMALDAVGITEDAAARSLHVQMADGELVFGTESFNRIWDHLPRYRGAARIMRLPVIRHIASAGYDWVVAPIIYRLFYKRLKAQRARTETR